MASVHRQISTAFSTGMGTRPPWCPVNMNSSVEARCCVSFSKHDRGMRKCIRKSSIENDDTVLSKKVRTRSVSPCKLYKTNANQ